MELLELWELFKKWHEQGNEGDLELAPDGSGGIRISEMQGDSYHEELVVSWGDLAEGVKVLTAQLTSNCPAMREYRRRNPHAWRS